MQNKNIHYIHYLSGIISEEQFQEIEEQLHENMLRNALGAGAMALGGLFGGPAHAQSTPQNPPAITAKSDFDVDGNDEDVYHDVGTYVKDLIKKLKLNKYNFESKYNRGQSKIIIQKVIKAEKQKNGDVYVTISGMARGTQGALAGKVQEAIKDRDLMGGAGSIKVYGIEKSGQYIGQVPQDVQSPGTDLYPFTATVQISK
jgi:hypothetical protein